MRFGTPVFALPPPPPTTNCVLEITAAAVGWARHTREFAPAGAHHTDRAEQQISSYPGPRSPHPHPHRVRELAVSRVERSHDDAVYTKLANSVQQNRGWNLLAVPLFGDFRVYHKFQRMFLKF